MSIVLIAIISGATAGYWYYRLRGSEPSRAVSATSSAPLAPSAAGWHGDPTGRNESRYWDGAAWTTEVSTAGINSNDPL